MAKEKVSKGIVHFCRHGATPPQTVNRDINAALNIAIVLRRDSGEREKATIQRIVVPFTTPPPPRSPSSNRSSLIDHGKVPDEYHKGTTHLDSPGAAYTCDACSDCL